MTEGFRGRHSVRLDQKGRFILPSLFRQSQKSSKFFITNNLYKKHAYLDVLTEKEWSRFEKKIAGMPSLNQDIQAFRRFYLSSAVPIQSDAQGRILVPQDLRDYAGIKEDLILVGVGGKFEIWNAQAWKQFQAEVTQNYEQILATVAKFEEGTD